MGKFIFFVSWMGLIGLSFENVHGQVYRYSELKTYASKAQADGMLKTERAVAKRFHELLNAYRAQKKLPALEWNEACFLAAHNHNQWMAMRSSLSHEQNSRNVVFTGVQPGDRLGFVLQGSPLHFSWSAENCLQSNVDNMLAISIEAVAAGALEQWRTSPGHNANMLGKNHGSCATAFKIVDGLVWGTTLFAFPEH